MNKKIIATIILSIGLFTSTTIGTNVFADNPNENKKNNFATVSGSSSTKISQSDSTPDTSQKAKGPKKPTGFDNIANEESNASSRYNHLLEKTKTHGQVRIIVGLDIDFKPEGEFATTSEKENQRANIHKKQNQLLDSLSSEIQSKKFKYIPFMVMTVNQNDLNKLISSPLVVSIEEDKIDRPHLSESTVLINADQAHTAGYTGSTQSVAILDTGVDKFHEFLLGKVISEACYSSTANLGFGVRSTTVCPGGGQSSTQTGSGVNCSFDGCWHGTHVAGIAAGNGDSLANPAPDRGTADGTDIIAIQVFSSFRGGGICAPDPQPCPLSFVSDQISALERVFELHNDLTFTQPIAAVNLSLGGGQFFDPCDLAESANVGSHIGGRVAAVYNLYSVGIATVASSGNAGFSNALGAPACISYAVSVGATTKADAVVSFSNSAYFLDVLAPGVSITSSFPGNNYAIASGTSMAAPHVTGTWAVLKQANPTATVNEILKALKLSGISITDSKSGITTPRIELTYCGKPISAFQIFLGNPGIDNISGTPGDDLIFAGAGNDNIKGNGGDDCIFGQEGNDTISGGAGNDEIDGGSGDDQITGRTGNDTIFGRTGSDTISGGFGGDTIFGGDDNDQLGGNEGIDTVDGGNGNDLCSGGGQAGDTVINCE